MWAKLDMRILQRLALKLSVVQFWSYLWFQIPKFLFTLILPLSVPLSDFHTHCFQLVCSTTLAWLALTLSPLSFVSFSSLISHNASLSFHSHKSRFTFDSLYSCRATLPRRPLAPSVSSWTRHSLWSRITYLSFYTFPSLGSLRSGSPGYSRHSIWTWNTGKTMAECRFLKIKIVSSLSGDNLCV